MLAPTWGIEAVRNAALGGEVWPGIGMCVLLGAIYLVLGAVFMQTSSGSPGSARPSSLT